MANESPLSIILCGKSKMVGQPVIDHLKPEYNVVNFVDSVERGVEEIPPSLKKDDIFAVVLGGGYDDAAYETIKKAATGSEMKKVYWMRPDKTKPGPGDDMKAYSQVIAARTKVKLDEVRSGNIAEGELVLF